tara:strand:+ start:69 stop:533 length:465 start_codon:yes stop_codon:yes gene_type:complete
MGILKFKSYFTLFVVLFSFVFPNLALACLDVWKVEISLEKAKKQTPKCIKFNLIYPNKVGIYNDVTVTLRSKFDNNYTTVIDLNSSRHKDNPEKLVTRVCMSEAALKGSSIALKYNLFGQEKGTRVPCGPIKVVDNLYELLLSVGKDNIGTIKE